jgi:hypothetical protein
MSTLLNTREVQSKIIEGFSNYCVYTDSRIQNILTRKFLKPVYIFGTRAGVQKYLKVNLINDQGEMISVRVHRIVAQAFIPNPLNKKTVNHIDFNVENNHVSNLEWCTQQENVTHSHSAGRMHVPHRKDKKHLKRDEVQTIKRHLSSTAKRRLTHVELALLFDVHHLTISSIKAGRTHSQIN